MSVWLAIPSARPAAEIKARLEKWRDMGYKIALWRNGPHVNDPIECEWLFSRPDYHGWGASINFIIERVMDLDPQADWFVAGGDDTDPDPTKRAEVIALECSDHFRNLHIEAAGETIEVHPTFGVMQPTGDRWGEKSNSQAAIDRICGSPWIGREFARRINQGKGPFWPEYRHMFADDELQLVAQRMGVLWQRRDLTHFHGHPWRDGVRHIPDFAREIYSREHWDASKALFEHRKEAGFPGSEPLV